MLILVGRAAGPSDLIVEFDGQADCVHKCDYKACSVVNLQLMSRQ